MRENFASDLARILKSEGGKVNNPKDPGGKTNMGVTQRTYTAWLRKNGLPLADVYAIPIAHVAQIYKSEYWDKICGDQLAAGLCYWVMDVAVNSGVSRAVMHLQACVGVRVDGVMGNATLTAANDYPNHDELIQRLYEKRCKFVRALKTYATFGKGWERRYEHVRVVAQEMATGAEPTDHVVFTMSNGKANIEDRKHAPSTKVASTVATTAGAGGTVSQATGLAAPVADVPAVAKIIGIITVLAFVAAGLAGLYIAWAGRKRHELDDALDVSPPPVPVVGSPANQNTPAEPSVGADELDAGLAA